MSKVCKQCKGKGTYWKTSSVDNFFSELRDCKVCNGKGIINDSKKK